MDAAWARHAMCESVLNRFFLPADSLLQCSRNSRTQSAENPHVLNDISKFVKDLCLVCKISKTNCGSIGL